MRRESSRRRSTRRSSRSRHAVGLALVALAVGLGAAGCLGSGSNNVSSTDAATTAAETAAATTAATSTAPATRTVRIYLVKDGKLAAEGRQVPATEAVGHAALTALLGDAVFDLSIANGVATVDGLGAVSHERAAEIVATLTQFPTVQAVELDGTRLTRLELEDVTPSILVESPLPDARVTAPLRVTGTANTFEASLIIEVLDADGNTLTRKLVTATSGSGTRGTFAAEIGFDTAGEQAGTLYAYEASAEDGSPIHQVRIPLTLLP